VESSRLRAFRASGTGLKKYEYPLDDDLLDTEDHIIGRAAFSDA
jgi:hypothetical protein